METNETKPWDARLAYRLVWGLRDTGVTPNHLTTLRLVFGVLAFGGLASGTWLWMNVGALCFVVSHFLDHTDGELARIKGASSPFGHYYDLAADSLCTVLLFVGIGIGASAKWIGASAIPMGCIAGIAVAAIFHMRHQIELQVGKADARQPHVGFMEAEDVLYLLPLITFFGKVIPFLMLAAIGAPLFAAWVFRDYYALRKLGNP